MSIDRWKNKQNVVNTYNEVFFSFKINSHTCCDTEGPQRRYAKWSKPITKDKTKQNCIIPLIWGI